MRCNSKINCSKQFLRHVIILAPIVTQQSNSRKQAKKGPISLGNPKLCAQGTTICSESTRRQSALPTVTTPFPAMHPDNGLNHLPKHLASCWDESFEATRSTWHRRAPKAWPNHGTGNKAERTCREVGKLALENALGSMK